MPHFDPHITRRSFALGAFAASIAGVPAVKAQALASPAVLYQPPQNYRVVYEAALKGIDAASSGGKPRRYRIRGDFNEAASWVKDGGHNPWLLLGADAYTAFSAARSQSRGFLAIAYLTRESHEGVGGVSLELDPEVVFAQCRALLPTRYRVHVIVDPAHEALLADRADSAARAKGLDLNLTVASDLSVATSEIQAALTYGNPATDVLWLLGSPSLISSETAGVLARRAWARRFPVFSSRTGLVHGGFLMGAEPDFEDTGRQLVELAAKASAEPYPIELTRKAKSVLNVRAARRLGVDVTPELRARVDLLVSDE
ncbi:MAG: hypothetical protein AAFY22_06795 [Pseudomonadota bacterium]